MRLREWDDKRGNRERLLRMAPMAHLFDKAHFVDKHILARVNTALMLGLIGTGLAACVFGAVVYDLGRLFSAW
jgi:hypothetical protein